MGRRSRIAVVGWILVTGIAPSVAAQEPAAATSQDGETAFTAGRYEDALAKFREALEKSQAPEILFHLGQTYAKLVRPVEALDHFERFLAAGAKSDARMQKEARAQAQVLVAQVGEITVRAKDGTPVSVDGHEVGKTPLAPFRVAAGIRKVALGTHQETVRVGGGGHVTVGPPPEPGETPAMLAVTPSAVPASSTPIDAAPAEPQSESLVQKWWFWTAVGVVAVGATAGILLATGGETAAEPLAASDASLAPVHADW